MRGMIEACTFMLTARLTVRWRPPGINQSNNTEPSPAATTTHCPLRATLHIATVDIWLNQYLTGPRWGT